MNHIHLQRSICESEIGNIFTSWFIRHIPSFFKKMYLLEMVLFNLNVNNENSYKSLSWAFVSFNLIKPSPWPPATSYFYSVSLTFQRISGSYCLLDCFYSFFIVFFSYFLSSWYPINEKLAQQTDHWRYIFLVKIFYR